MNRQSENSIFRRKMIRRYHQGQNGMILPRLISPSFFLGFWILLGLFSFGFGIALRVELPVYTSGMAVIVNPEQIPGLSGEDPVLAAMLPADTHEHVKIGQLLFLSQEGDIRPVIEPIIHIDPGLASPDELRRDFGLDAQTMQRLKGPAAVVIAGVDSILTTQSPSLYEGTLYDVDVEIGSQQVLTLFMEMWRS